MEEGARIGCADGTVVGCEVGKQEGLEDGCIEGMLVGEEVG